MTALGQHIRCRLHNDGPLADTIGKRRLLARTALEIGREFDLLSFGCVDTHLHLVKAGADGGEEYARRLEIALSLRSESEVGFEPARVKPVLDLWHLYRAFDYALRQDQHHNVPIDPLRDATNLPDLLGLRLAGAYTIANVRRFLPRVDRGQLLGLLGSRALELADGPVEELPSAAAAAICREQLVGHSRETQAARRAVLAILGDRLAIHAAAELLEVHRVTVRRLRRAPADPALVNAVRLQLGLRRARWSAAIGKQDLASYL
jgi:hypothetical protein